jgi:hypothetical protein
MRNLTSDHMPLLATRAPRALYKTLTAPGGLYAWEKLCWVDGDGFFVDGERKGTVTAGQKTFAALGAYIIILPDKAYYNTDNGEFGSIESAWQGNSLTLTNGRLFDEEADANTIHAAGVDWNTYFRAGDAVTIEGATKHPQNNKTSIIREIDGDKLHFYEFAFTLDGTDSTVPYTETGSLSIKRTFPDLLYVCQNENRLWGCDKTTIYASKLGDIFNWNVYDGLETDSYAVDTGSAGSFTACYSFLGYPVFFKEEHIYKVYGSMPSNFEVMESATLGVAEGSAGSLAVAGEVLFYLSRAGIMAYSGGIPQPVGQAFGTEKMMDAVAGSDGLKYYVSVAIDNSQYRLYVYDSQRHVWHTEDETRATHFAKWGGDLYFVNDKGEIWNVNGNPSLPADAVGWSAEFADFAERSPNKKGIAKILMRLELDEGASMEIFMRFDSEGEWQKVAALEANAKRSYYLPIVPRRADHYRMKLEGVGGCRVYSMVREYYSGSAN